MNNSTTILADNKKRKRQVVDDSDEVSGSDGEEDEAIPDESSTNDKHIEFYPFHDYVIQTLKREVLIPTIPEVRMVAKRVYVGDMYWKGTCELVDRTTNISFGNLRPNEEKLIKRRLASQTKETKADENKHQQEKKDAEQKKLFVSKEQVDDLLMGFEAIRDHQFSAVGNGRCALTTAEALAIYTRMCEEYKATRSPTSNMWLFDTNTFTFHGRLTVEEEAKLSDRVVGKPIKDLEPSPYDVDENEGDHPWNGPQDDFGDPTDEDYKFHLAAADKRESDDDDQKCKDVPKISKPKSSKRRQTKRQKVTNKKASNKDKDHNHKTAIRRVAAAKVELDTLMFWTSRKTSKPRTTRTSQRTAVVGR